MDHHTHFYFKPKGARLLPDPFIWWIDVA